ncbi:MAG TPA: DUF6111 family protein [Stellaceae bacterium]|nr:DUF6111 family protein [Stellaceae bacterium]
MRALLTVILPLLLPTLLYLVWALAMRRIEATGMVEVLRSLPWVWLVPAGVALVAIALIALPLGFGGNGGGVYVPPQIVNGKLVPGHLAPAAKP